MEQITKKNKLLHYLRPPVPHPFNISNGIDVFVTDVTSVHTENPWGPVIRIYGVTEGGNSICVNIRNFDPYFYVLKHPKFDVNQLESKLVGKKPDHIKFVKNIELTRKRLLMGYNPAKQDPEVYKITMSSPKFVTQARNMIEKAGVPTYEANVLYTMRYMIDVGFGGCHWLHFDNCTFSERATTNCQIELDAQKVTVLNDKIELATGFRTLFFDLEILKVGLGYQGAKIDPIIMISSVLVDANHTVLDRRVFSMTPENQSIKQPLPNPNVELDIFENESHMILDWVQYVKYCQPDIMSNYNGDGFDWPYLFERAETLGIIDLFKQFSRDDYRPVTIRECTFSSAATGTRKDFEVNIEGCISFDLLKYVKSPAARIKLRSYTLGSVLSHVLMTNKVEMPYYLIPKFYHGTPEQRAHLCHYAWYDSEALNDLMNKQMVLVTYVEKARVCGVPFKFLVTRGMQILVFSLLIRYCKKRNIVVPSFTESQNDEKTLGANVLNPKKKHYKNPVATLDFSSLYPSIIECHNICYTTKVDRKWAQKNLKEDEYYTSPTTGITFVSDDIFPGVLPEMESTLRDLRNQTKALMKAEIDPYRKGLFDCRQLAVKLCMNSIYGFVKANTVCDMDLMSAVTDVGRWMIDTTADLVETNFPNTQIVYGDSVTGDTPLLLKSSLGDVVIRSIKSLGDVWEDYPQFKPNDQDRFEKEQSNVPGWKIWTYDRTLNNGSGKWTDIKRVIRHKTTKKIYRVLTHTGCVDVTEDHSLLDKKCNIIKPKECDIGTELLHAPIEILRTKDFKLEDITKFLKDLDIVELSLQEQEAFIQGFFFGDGSSGKYGSKSGVKYTWALNNKNTNYLNVLKRYLTNVYKQEFKILDTLKSSGVYKLVPKGKLKPMTMKYTTYYNEDRQKIIPEEILNGSGNLKKLFFYGYYAADGSKCTNEITKCIRCDTKGKTSAAQLFYLLRSIGFSCSINTRADKPNIFRITATLGPQRKDPNTIKKITQISTSSTEEFVYDIETEEGYFQAGVGEMVVKNTDSVFVECIGRSIEDSFELGAKCAAFCTEFFNQSLIKRGKKPVHKLEMEKLFEYLILLEKKKKYAGKKLMYFGAKPTLSTSGLETVRRDNALIASEAQETCLRMILMEGDLDGQKAVAYVHNQISLLLAGKIPMSKLIITRGLSKSFEHYEKSGVKQPHVELAKRINERKHLTGEQGYYTGDRVKYVITGNLKGTKMCDRAEDPSFVIQNRLSIDYRYYIENQLMKPLLRIFIPVLHPEESILKKNGKGDMVDITMKEIEKLQTYKDLFVGPHMMKHVTQKINNNGHGIMGFLVAKETCLHCHATVTPKEVSYGHCKHCQDYVPVAAKHLEEECLTLQTQRREAWTTCQNCIKSDTYSEDVPCSNTDCDNFYQRDKVMVDIEDLGKKLTRIKKK